MSNKNILRKTAEEQYQKELDALIAAETDPIPTGWRMSPRSVLTYIMGNVKVGGVEITPKYMGNRRLVEIAIATAGDRINGAVLASDAFFPFPDSVERIHNAGIQAIIQPGGSIRDQEVIDACNKYGIAMIFTGKRHFRH